MKGPVLFTLGLLGVLFLGVIVRGISVMGDRYCVIELQNSGKEILSIKTIKFTNNEWTSIVDSVAVAPHEKIEIGNCINCHTFKQSDFDFDAVVIFTANKEPKLVHRKDLFNYLNSHQRVDCATIEVQ